MGERESTAMREGVVMVLPLSCLAVIMVRRGSHMEAHDISLSIFNIHPSPSLVLMRVMESHLMPT